jgi:preprotein translocase subunit YajC
MLPVLFAQDPAGGQQNVPFFLNPFFLLVIFALFWIVFVLPMSRRQKKEQQAMLASLKPGAKVVTSAGIVGTVVTAKDGEEEIVVRSEDARLKILRSAVIKVLGDEAKANK